MIANAIVYWVFMRASPCSVTRSRGPRGLLDALPDQIGASTARSSGIGVLQLVAGDREGPLLGCPVPVRIGAGLDVEREGLVLLVHRIPADVADHAADDRLILVRGSFLAIAGGELRQAGARDVKAVAAVGSENQRSPRIGPEDRSPLAGCVDIVGRYERPRSDKALGSLRGGIAGGHCE